MHSGWLQSDVKQRISDTCRRRNSAAQDAFFWNAGVQLGNASERICEGALEWKQRQIEDPRRRLLCQANEVGEYDLSWKRTYSNPEWLNAGAAKWTCRELGPSAKQQGFYREKVGIDEHPELFQNEMVVQAGGESLRSIQKRNVRELKWADQ